MGDHSRFAVFILTHGRPDNQRTVRALTKNGYTGPIYWLIDTDDMATIITGLYDAER